MSSILSPPVTTAVPIMEWVSDNLLMSRRLSGSEPVGRACLMSNTAHLLIVGPNASAKKYYNTFKYLILLCLCMYQGSSPQD